MTWIAAVNETALVVFAVVVAITLVISWVRSETGLGAEGGTGLTLTGRHDGDPAEGDAERERVATPG